MINTTDFIDLEIPLYWDEYASDYHDFDELKQRYERLLHKPVFFEEIGLVDRNYQAIFYLAEHEPKELIARLKEAQKAH